MNIKQAAQKSGISERNIRYYEQAGLITPARNPENDYRQYTEENMRTLKMIRILRSVDMPVEDIRDVLQGKTALSDAALAQKQRLQDRMQTLKAAADFCSELNETCCSADALDVDACLTRMKTPAQAGWFTGWVQDYTKVASALAKEQFSFTPDSEVRTPQQVSAALFAYAEQQNLDIVITHESMTPRFTLNGAEYTARVVYTPVMRVPTAHISCQMVGASEADAAVPAPRRRLQRGLHKALPGILLLLVIGLLLGSQGMLNSADGWALLGGFAAVAIAKSVYDFYWLYNHNDKH